MHDRVLAQIAGGVCEARAPARAVVVPNSYASPDAVTFGVAEIGEQLETTVVIGLRNVAHFTATAGLAPGTSATIHAVNEYAPSTYAKTFRVSQNVNRRGTCTGTAWFEIATENGEHDRLEVPISYYGITRADGDGQGAVDVD
jgi:hypothetical protein